MLVLCVGSANAQVFKAVGLVGATPPPEPGPLSGAFTVATIPDTQNYTNSAPTNAYPGQQTQWILDNRVARNIAFVTHLGDVVSLSTQWGVSSRGENISDAMALLDGVIPYNVNQGNHDSDTSDAESDTPAYICPCTNWLALFDESRYTGITGSGIGGQHSGRTSLWHTFTASGITWLIFSLEFEHFYAPNGTYAWAQGVIDANPGLPVIVTTHAYLQWGGRNTTWGTALWDGLIKLNPEIVMVINGHHVEPIAGVTSEFHQVSLNNAGLPVVEILANYQQVENSGVGWLQVIEFDMYANLVNVQTYTPVADEFQLDGMSQFSIPLAMYPRLTECNNGIDDDLDGDTDINDTNCATLGGASEN